MLFLPRRPLSFENDLYSRSSLAIDMDLSMQLSRQIFYQRQANGAGARKIHIGRDSLAVVPNGKGHL